MLTFMEFYDIRLRTISQEVFMNLIRNMCSDIMLLKLLPHLTEACGLVLAMSTGLFLYKCANLPVLEISVWRWDDFISILSPQWEFLECYIDIFT